MITTISNQFLSASIKSTGAELSSLNCQGREYIWNADPAFWPKHAPVLFPIVGTLKNNRYTHQNQEYQMNRHGFARDREFRLTDHTPSSAEYSLSQDESTLQVYPFHFTLQIIYHLEQNRLVITYKVTNTDSDTIYFSLGAHPAISLPRAFEDYELKFKKTDDPIYQLLENDLLSKNTQKLSTSDGRLRLSYKLFEHDALVFRSVPSKSLEILEQGKPYIIVDYPDFPDLGLWTKPGAPFICVEPWFGHADFTDSSGRLTEKAGILSLPYGEVFSCQFALTIPNE